MIAPLIRSEADSIEQLGTLSPAVVGALRDSNLFWLLLPTEFGGGGQGIVAMLEVLEEISCADGSTGWALMANAGSIALAACAMSSEGLHDLFQEKNKAITAGQLLPVGRATKVDGGYIASGRFSFASGSAHADQIGAGFFVEADGQRVIGEDGAPQTIVGLFPRSDVTFLGNWDVSGLVGTGSFDYEIDQVFVPDHLTFDLMAATTRPEPVFTLGAYGIGLAGHAGVALGLMKRSLQEVARITDGKTRAVYPGRVDEHPLFLDAFAKHEALYQAARAFVMQAYGDAEATAAAGQALTTEQQSRFRQALAWSTSAAADVVRFAHTWSGTQSFRNPSAVGRAYRDISVATQHLHVDPIAYTLAAQPVLDAWRHTND